MPTPGTGSKFSVGVLSYKIAGQSLNTLLTYRAGMTIDEYFNESVRVREGNQ